MPFQFECTRCREDIKVPDGTGGKKTRCPHCQAVIEIPMRQVAEPQPTPHQDPLADLQPEHSREPAPSPPPMRPVSRGEPERAAGEIPQRNPFGETFQEPQEENPYATPSFKPKGGDASGSFLQRDPAEARQKLLIPSVIALVVIVGSVLMVGLLVFGGVILVIEGDDEGVATLTMMSVFLALQMPALIGILSATFRWNYTLAWVGFICSLVPCTNACAGSVLPIAVAIWGMVVLSDPAVRQQFRS
ncbi:MAG: hypothetical protein WEE51_11655 [Pirellulaceae bacterium]